MWVEYREGASSVSVFANSWAAFAPRRRPYVGEDPRLCRSSFSCGFMHRSKECQQNDVLTSIRRNCSYSSSFRILSCSCNSFIRRGLQACMRCRSRRTSHLHHVGTFFAIPVETPKPSTASYKSMLGTSSTIKGKRVCRHDSFSS